MHGSGHDGVTGLVLELVTGWHAGARLGYGKRVTQAGCLQASRQAALVEVKNVGVFFVFVLCAQITHNSREQMAHSVVLAAGVSCLCDKLVGCLVTL